MAKTKPWQIVKHATGKLCGHLDSRYTIAQEFIGKEKQQHVLRYCGDFISSHGDRDAAIIAAKLHKIGY